MELLPSIERWWCHSVGNRPAHAFTEDEGVYLEATARMKTDRDALEAIRDYPANGNSEPDVMARAIEAMQAIAAAQLEGEDWEYPERNSSDDM
jgi:hypothetical protein